MLLFLLFFCLARCADYTCSFDYTIPLESTTWLNIRAEAGTWSDILVTIDPGTEVTYEGDYEIIRGLLWVKIRGSEWTGDGWAAQKYLKPTPEDSLTLKVTSTTTSLSVRDGPCTTYGRDTILSGGDVVGYTGIWVTNCDLLWVMISEGKWTAAKYLEESTSFDDSTTSTDSNVKYVETLNEIFGHEGSCQNWNSDTGNWFNGKKGYTCMGITPSVGWDARYLQFSFARASFVGQERSPEMFVKHAYDYDTTKFKEGAASIYTENYFYVCEELRQPAFYVCCDVSVNSGPPRSSQFKRELKSQQSLSKWQLEPYATAFNQLHRDFYYEIAPPGSSNYQFLAGWLARANKRDDFIEDYCWSHHCQVNVVESGMGSRALSPGAIAGVVVGTVGGIGMATIVAVVLVVVCCCCCGSGAAAAASAAADSAIATKKDLAKHGADYVRMVEEQLVEDYPEGK